MRIDVHIHHHNDDLAVVLDRLDTQESTMSALSDAVSAQNDAIASLVDRIDTDVAHLQDLLAQAIAAGADDAAERARLEAEVAATVDSITANTSAMTSLDPLPDFPGQPPVEQPVEENPNP